MTLTCFEPSALKSPHHNFVVHALMILKLGTDMEPDVFQAMVTNHFVTLLLLSTYDAMTGIYAKVKALGNYILVTPKAPG